MSSCLELHCLELAHACIATRLTAPEHGVCVCAQRDVHKAVNNFKADIKQGKTFRDIAHEKRVKNEFRQAQHSALLPRLVRRQRYSTPASLNASAAAANPCGLLQGLSAGGGCLTASTAAKILSPACSMLGPFPGTRHKRVSQRAKASDSDGSYVAGAEDTAVSSADEVR